MPSLKLRLNEAGKFEPAPHNPYDGLAKEVRVGCYTFTVNVTEAADAAANNEFGHTNFLSLRIRLSPNQAPQQLANTMLHECMHAIHWVYGLRDDSDEESFTNLSANGLCAFFQDNPDVMTWLRTNLEMK